MQRRVIENRYYTEAQELRTQLETVRTQLKTALEGTEDVSGSLLERLVSYQRQFDVANNRAARVDVGTIHKGVKSLDFVENLSLRIRGNEAFIKGTMRGLILREKYNSRHALRLPPVFFNANLQLGAGLLRMELHTTTPHMEHPETFGISPSKTLSFKSPEVNRYLSKKQYPKMYKAHPHCYGYAHQCFGTFKDSMNESVIALDLKAWLCQLKDFLENCNSEDMQGSRYRDFMFGDPDVRFYTYNLMTKGQYVRAYWSPDLSRWGVHKDVGEDVRFYVSPREYVVLSADERNRLSDKNMPRSNAICESFNSPMPDVRSRVVLDPEKYPNRPDIFNLYLDVKVDRNIVVSVKERDSDTPF